MGKSAWMYVLYHMKKYIIVIMRNIIVITDAGTPLALRDVRLR
jgi:hypothetical protein